MFAAAVLPGPPRRWGFAPGCSGARTRRLGLPRASVYYAAAHASRHHAPGRPDAASSASVWGSTRLEAPGRAPMRLLPAGSVAGMGSRPAVGVASRVGHGRRAEGSKACLPMQPRHSRVRRPLRTDGHCTATAVSRTRAGVRLFRCCCWPLSGCGHAGGSAAAECMCARLILCCHIGWQLAQNPCIPASPVLQPNKRRRHRRHVHALSQQPGVCCCSLGLPGIRHPAGRQAGRPGGVRQM